MIMMMMMMFTTTTATTTTTTMTTRMMTILRTGMMTFALLCCMTSAITVDAFRNVHAREPSVDKKTYNRTVTEGENAILPCIVHDLGTHKVKVAWVDQWNTVLTLNTITIIDDPRIRVQKLTEENWTLQINKIKYGDQGVYVCQINTEPALQVTVVLTVQVPPSITSVLPSSVVTLKEGETAKLSCNATGIPNPSITWYRQPRNGVAASNHHQHGPMDESKIGKAGEVLFIYNMTRHCGGKYVCAADNDVSPKATKVIDVKVIFAPEVKLANNRMGQKLGRDTILECVISGYPSTITSWIFKGDRIGSSDKYKLEVYEHQDQLETMTISLHIKNISREDFGVYTCSSTNVEGTASDRMTLYHYKERAPPTTTTTTTTTTTRPRHQIGHTFSSMYGEQQLPPKGRLGVGQRREHSRERMEVIETRYRSHTRPAEASIQVGRNNSTRREELCLSSVVSLAVCALVLARSLLLPLR